MADELTEERWVGINEASGAWAGAALEVLSEVASNYLGVITYADLAEQVQARTRLRTRSSYRNWIGGVQAAVVSRCRTQGLPPLTSLVVHRAAPGVDTEAGTVHARLTCYRRFAADIPAEVIAIADAADRAKEDEAAAAARERNPKARARTSTRSGASTRSPAPRERRSKVDEDAPKICPSCFVQLPASGICDDCG